MLHRVTWKCHGFHSFQGGTCDHLVDSKMTQLGMLDSANSPNLSPLVIWADWIAFMMTHNSDTKLVSRTHRWLRQAAVLWWCHSYSSLYSSFTSESESASLTPPSIHQMRIHHGCTSLADSILISFVQWIEKVCIKKYQDKHWSMQDEHEGKLLPILHEQS